MKRKSLLLLLIFALGAPWAAKAQTYIASDAGIIGTGTSATTTLALPGLWKYHYDVSLYDASKVDFDGVINSIAWYVTALTENTDRYVNFEVYLRDVSSSFSLSANSTFDDYAGSATLVYSSDDMYQADFTTNAWNTFIFNENDFVHERGNALLVCVRGVSSYSSGGCSKTIRYTSVSNKHWYKLQDTNDPGWSTTGSLNAYLANIRLSIGNQQYVTTCSGTFYDSGGASGNYGEYEDYTWTFQPGTSGAKIQLDFTEFDTENGYDYLHIYDGTSTSDPEIGAYNVDNISAPFSVCASNSSGALTCYWHSDVSNVGTGFAANISCVTGSPLTFGAEPSGGGTVSVTSNGTAVSSGAAVQAGTTLNITATANTNYVFAGWTVTGTGASVADASSATTTLTMGSDATTLTANFIAPATIPYSCNFESSSENSGWVFSNGSYTNKWMIGEAASTSSSHSLYISNNNVANTYTNSSSSYVYAYRKVNITSTGNYEFSFKWHARGESGCWDAMYAALVPSGTACPPASNITSNTNSLPDGYINVSDVSQSHNTSGVFLWTYNASDWITSTKTVSISTTGVYTLVFYWKNDNSGGSNPPAAIDDISIRKMYTVELSADPSGGGTVSGAGTYAAGTSVTITATPAEGYSFIGWYTSTGTSVSYHTASYTFSSISSNQNLVARFISNSSAYLMNAAANGTTTTVTGCSGYLYDEGGPDYQYCHNSVQWTRTLLPDEAGMMLKATFTAFSTESVDHLYIYDGTSTSAPLIGNYSGTTSPGTVVATNVSGALTFKWTTDSSATYYLGFAATLSCESPTQETCEDFEGVTGTSYNTAGSMPAGWYSYTTGTGSNIVAPHVTSGSNYNYYHSSSQSVNLESGTNASSNIAYVVMPANTSGNGYASLSFWYRQENTSSGYGTLKVGYVTAQTATACGNFTEIASITPSTTLHQETVDISSAPSNAYIAFWWQVTTGSYYACCIDDVCVTTGINCTITTTAGTGGTATGGGTYTYGQSCTVNATPNSGYIFNNWTIDGNVVSTNASYTFTVQGSCTLVANFMASSSYTVNYETGALNQFGFVNDATYPWIITSNGYNSSSFSMKSGNEGHDYTSSDIEATVEFISSGTISFYSYASSESSWDYGRFFIDGTQQFEESGENNSWTLHTYDVAAGTHTFKWRFYKDSSNGYGDDCFYVDDIVFTGGGYFVNVVPNNAEAGTATVGNNGAQGAFVASGNTTSLSATANTGYTFQNWTGNGSASSSNPYSITVNASHTYTANFRIITHTLTTSVNPTGTGTITCNPSVVDNVEVGTGTGTSGVTPFNTAWNYSFSECLYLASEINTAAGYITSISYHISSGTAQTNNIVVYMKNVSRSSFASSTDFETISNSDKVFDGAWTLPTSGWATLYLDTPFYYDGTSNLLIAFDENTSGHTSCNFYVSEVSNTRIASWSDSNIDPFNSSTYNHTGVSSTRANVRLEGAYNHGTSVQLTATPNSGYTFTGWTVDGSSVGSTNPYTITMNADHNVVANFVVTTHTLTLAQNPSNSGTLTVTNNGSTVTSGSQVAEGAVLNINASPHTGYSFTSWSVSGAGSSVADPTAATTTFTMGTANATLTANFTLNSYQVSVSADPTVGGSVTGGGTYNHGASCTVTATANTGYTFEGWYEGNNRVSTNTSYTFNVQYAISLVARFTLNSYAITVQADPTVGGNVTGGGTYNHGATANLTATENSGYTFQNWTKNGTVVSTNANYSPTITEAATYIAHFTLNSYQITVSANPSAGGNVSGGGTYNHGASCTVSTTVNTGYTFDGWYEGNTLASSNTSYTFTVSGARTLEARFTLNSYQIAVSANPSAGGNVSGGGTYNHGASCTVSTTVNTGYTFDGWYEGNTLASSNTSYTFTVSGARTLEARYTLTDFTITYTDDGNGSCTGPATANYGDNVILTVTPNANYEVASVTYNDGSSHTITPVGGVYSFTMPASAVTVNATFVQTAFAITYSPDSNNPSNGCYLSGNSTATAGSTVTVSITEATGYELVSISAIDGNNQTVTLNGSGSTRTFTMPATTVAVSATFQASTYNINIASGITNGSVTTSPSGSAAYGQSVTVNLSPDMGYEVATVTVTNNTTGTAVTTSGSGNTRTFTMPAGDVTVSATFSQISYNITYTYGPNGTCSGVATAHYGETVSVTVSPANNYGLNTLTYTPAGGSAVDITLTQEFTMPAGDVTVYATFIQATRYITVSPYPAGTGTVSGGGSYLQGSSCTVTASANPGYSFQYWEENSASVSTSASYTFTVTGDRTLVAHFEQDRTLVTYADPMEGGWVTTDLASTIGAIEVGTGTGGSSGTPYGTAAEYSFQECLYLANEINASAGWITSISYMVNVNQTAHSNHIEVFMKNVSISSFNNIVTVSAADKVYDGALSIPHSSNTTWTTIVLDTPFYYDGTSNLMIGIHENTSGAINTSFIRTQYSSIRRVTIYGSHDMDPVNLNTTGLSTTGGQDCANVRLGFGTYANGQTVTLTAHPSTDYAFEGWYENNALVSSNATYAVAIDADHTLTARFVPPVFTRFITGHQGGTGYWYLIASPLAADVSPTNVTGMISDNYDYTVNPALAEYDLYWFDRTQTLEWRNYRLSAFNLVNGQGYLYASKQDVTLTFRGIPYRGNGSFPLTEDNTNTDPVMHKLNLMGNPFPEAVTASVPYYAMNNGGTEISIQSSNATIPAMEGVFMQYNAQNATNVTFTPTSKGRGVERDELLVLELFNDGENDVIDRAIVNFSRNFMVRKAQLNPNHTKVYLPVGGLDYAMIHSATDVDEIPVSFKAERNGVYTFGVSAEEVGFTYLHLIDNLTGADVDLLNNPTYTFEARTTDYATRFRLVFAAGETTQDIFGFYNNGSWVINNDGEATVQVIDVLGRILKSQSIDGCANIYFKAAPGVYMLRLIKGNEMKVQKVVVHQQY